jgi:putative thioredoxin
VTTVLDVTEATFEAEVLDRSLEVPVVVDFWAEWCAPCRALGPVLEKLAVEAAGSWRLAKVDVDSNRGLAAGFRVQGIPAVKGFKSGRLVAEFTGALPEPQVREWLEQLGPTELDLAREAARAEPSEEAWRKVLSLDPFDREAKREIARLELARSVDDDGPFAEADRLMADGDVDGAVGYMLARLAGPEREEARKHLLLLLDLLEPDDPRALAARKRLALALY